MNDLNQMLENFDKEDEAYLILYIILCTIADGTRVEKIWKYFVDEIKTKSRFFPQK